MTQAWRKFTGKPKPAPYDLDDTSELYRLLAECHGYLRTCHHKHGTDWEGRQFAMDALDKLLRRDWKLVPNPPGDTPALSTVSQGSETQGRATMTRKPAGETAHSDPAS